MGAFTPCFFGMFGGEPILVADKSPVGCGVALLPQPVESSATMQIAGSVRYFMTRFIIVGKFPKERLIASRKSFRVRIATKKPCTSLLTDAGLESDHFTQRWGLGVATPFEIPGAPGFCGGGADGVTLVGAGGGALFPHPAKRPDARTITVNRHAYFIKNRSCS